MLDGRLSPQADTLAICGTGSLWDRWVNRREFAKHFIRQANAKRSRCAIISSVAKLSEKIVREIAEKRQRNSVPDLEASWRSSVLLQTFHNPTSHTDELLRYFPIAVVSMIEGYFRARLASLIGSGDPFLSNALRGYSEVKLDMSLAGALATRQVSLGELITHSNAMSINSFSDLIQIVRNTSGRPDFLLELAKVEPEFLDASKGKPIIADPKAAWAHLGKVFEVRHILCHELASTVVLDKAETRLLLLAAQDFLKASSIWFDKLQNPHPKPTFEEQLRGAQERGTVARYELNSQFRNLKEVAKDHLFSDKFRQSIVDVEHHVEGVLSTFGELHSSLSDNTGYRLRDDLWEADIETQILEKFTSGILRIAKETETLRDWERKYADKTKAVTTRRKRGTRNRGTEET
jgi:hypothetical protein